MSDNTPRLGLAELAQMQEMDSATWNEALVQIDALADLYLLGQFVNTPPGSPADGDLYLTGGTPTGAWSGYAYKIAYCIDGGWRFFTPFNGLRAFVAASNAFLLYVGGSWIALDYATRTGSETLTNKTLSGAVVATQYAVASPASGSTYTVADQVQHLILDNSVGAASLTVVTPPNPIAGQEFRLAVHNAYAGLTVQANTGQAGALFPSGAAAAAGYRASWKFSTAGNVWYPCA
jgi:hypothetical protein